MPGNCTLGVVLLHCINFFPAHTHSLYSMLPCLTLTSASCFSFCQSQTDNMWSFASSTAHKWAPPFCEEERYYIHVKYHCSFSHLSLFKYSLSTPIVQISHMLYGINAHRLFIQNLKRKQTKKRLPTLRRQRKWQLGQSLLLQSHEECLNWQSPTHGHEAARPDGKKILSYMHMIGASPKKQIQGIVHIKINIHYLLILFTHMYNILHTLQFKSLGQ